METTLIYRWEHRMTRQGPYNPGVYTPEVNELSDFVCARHDDIGHPNGYDDGITWGAGTGRVCACPSREMLDAWFSDIPECRLRGAGFVLAAYSCPVADVQVGRSGKQCSFTQALAMLTEEI